MNVLVLAPHADDEVLGCGGTIARHVAEGDSVTIVVATRGIPELFPDEEMEQIRGEARKAHALLGVSETRFFDFPAPALDTVPRYKLAGAIGDVIRELDPINPQTAARFVPALGRLRRIEPARAARMRAELEKIAAQPSLSRDVLEQVTKSLG